MTNIIAAAKEQKVVYNIFLPVPGFRAINLFGTIFARRKYKPLPLRSLVHEYCHTLQACREGGWWRFYWRYFKQWIRQWYRENPYEEEARRLAILVCNSI